MQQQAGACSAQSMRANAGLAPEGATLLVSVHQMGQPCSAEAACQVVWWVLTHCHWAC